MEDVYNRLVITALTDVSEDKNVDSLYTLGAANSSKAMRFFADPSKLVGFQPPPRLKVIVSNANEIFRNVTIHPSAWSQNPFNIKAKFVSDHYETIEVLIPSLFVERFTPDFPDRQLCLCQKYGDTTLRLCFSRVRDNIFFTTVDCKKFQ